MANDALTWALAQALKRAPVKFVLTVLANAADRHTHRAFLSTACVCEQTALDRKTVLACFHELRALGLIADTGERVGATRQVVVYQLNTPKNGTVKESQNRDSSPEEAGGNSPVFPMEQSRFSVKQSQKRDTEPVLTFNSNLKSESTHATVDRRPRFELPSWLPAPAWQEWLAYRGPSFGQQAQVAAINQFEQLRGEGHCPALLINLAIQSGWKSFYGRDTTRAGTPVRPGESLVDRAVRRLSAIERVREANASAGFDDRSARERVVEGAYEVVPASSPPTPVRTLLAEPPDPRLAERIAFVRQCQHYGQLTAQEAETQIANLRSEACHE